MKPQNVLNKESIIEKEEHSWRHSDFQTRLQIYSNQIVSE